MALKDSPAIIPIHIPSASFGMPVYSLKAKKTPTGIAKNQNEITRLSIVANVSLWPLSVPIAENLEHQVFEILQTKIN